MWALTSPVLPADFVLLDEAQDTNPVLEEIFLNQPAQRICVGDPAQQIYGWRNARDVMTGLPAQTLPLTHSFRFGQPIADVANRWLRHADRPADAAVPPPAGPYRALPPRAKVCGPVFAGSHDVPADADFVLGGLLAVSPRVSRFFVFVNSVVRLGSAKGSTQSVSHPSLLTGTVRMEFYESACSCHDVAAGASGARRGGRRRAALVAV